MHVEAFVLLKPRLHFRMLVRGIVVDDQMQLKVLGRFSIGSIDLFEKLHPFLVPVLALDGTDQASLEIIQRSEQGDGAMAHIVVRLRADNGVAVARSRSCLGHPAFAPWMTWIPNGEDPNGLFPSQSGLLSASAAQTRHTRLRDDR